MANVIDIGDKRVGVITKDDIAVMLRNSILWARTPAGASEAQQVRRLVRSTLPVLTRDQVAIVLTAFAVGFSLTEEWRAFDRELRQAS